MSDETITVPREVWDDARKYMMNLTDGHHTVRISAVIAKLPDSSTKERILKFLGLQKEANNWFWKNMTTPATNKYVEKYG
jgi:hypothetical protein